MNISLTPFNKAVDLLDRIKREVESKGGDINNFDITLEYMLQALFPDALENLKSNMAAQYIQGFNEGLKEKPLGIDSNGFSNTKLNTFAAYAKNDIDLALVELNNATRILTDDYDATTEDFNKIELLKTETKYLQQLYKTILGEKI